MYNTELENCLSCCGFDSHRQLAMIVYMPWLHMIHAYLLACPLQKKVLQKDEEEKSRPKQPLIGMLQPL